MMDDRIREALKHAPEGEPPVGDSWVQLERRERRGNLGRRVTSAVAALALIAAGVTVARELGERDAPPNFAGGDPTPSGDRTPTGDETATAQAEIGDEVVGYAMAIPPGWQHHVAPEPTTPANGGGTVTLSRVDECADEGSPTCSEGRGFFITVHPERGRDYEEWSEYWTSYLQGFERRGADVSVAAVTVAGRRASTVGIIYPDTEGSGDPWCRDCRRVEYFIEWQKGWVLQVSIDARSQGAFERHGGTALQMVGSLRVTEGVAADASGVVAPGILMDDPTRALIAWMDARIAGERADHHIAEELAGDDDGWMYGWLPDPSGERDDYVSYRIDRRNDPNDQDTYEVILTAKPAKGESYERRERISVGPGRAARGGKQRPFLIIAAQDLR